MVEEGVRLIQGNYVQANGRLAFISFSTCIHLMGLDKDCWTWSFALCAFGWDIGALREIFGVYWCSWESSMACIHIMKCHEHLIN